ncbi:MAG: hypothetical protein RL196_1401 [Actinomycetota bacterium]|jgi:MinD-like ATPase involved in chromosome partitioning or flagellar assembly
MLRLFEGRAEQFVTEPSATEPPTPALSVPPTPALSVPPAPAVSELPTAVVLEAPARAEPEPPASAAPELPAFVLPALAASPPELPAPPSQQNQERAKTIAFSGAAGSPGKTSLCINVAYELAAAGKKVAVVDFDLSSPSLLTALNQDSITAGLAGVRRLALQGRFFSEDLSRLLMVLNFDGVRLSVLPGMAKKILNSPLIDNSWLQITDELLALLRQDFDYVVIDLPDLATEPSLIVHLLNRVDYGFAVSAADPVSVERWLWFKTQLDSLGVIETPALVVNQVRDSVLGSNARGQLSDTFERVAKTEVACFIAQDAAAFDLAMREGLPLQLAKKASPARHAISMLVRQGILNQRSRLDWRVARLG